MNTSNHLLHLVASMTKQEKRYFKLYAGFYNKDKGNTCLQLFSTIDKEKPENEERLAEAVQTHSYKERLAAVKNHLTELILDSLAAFHASKQTSFQIQQLIAHADILSNKGLYAHSRKLLARAEKKARETEETEFLLEIFSRKRALLIRQVSDSFETDIDHLYEQADTDLSLLLHTNNYLKLMDLMQVISARYAAHPTPKDREKLRAIIEHPLLRDESKAVSFAARLARYNTLGTYALLTNNIEQATEHYKQATQLWKSSPVMIKERPSQYQRYLFNYLNCLLSNPDEEEFTTVIRDAKALPSSFLDARNTTLATIWNIELLYYLNRGQLDKSGRVIEEVEKGMPRHAEHISPLTYITLCYNCSVYYFLTERYHKALTYLHIILNEHRIEIKRDLQEFARVLSLITHYELDNSDILDNMIRSTKRYLKQRNTLGTLEHTVLVFIKSLLYSVDKTSSQQLFKTLYTELAAILHNLTGQEQPGLLELLFWTESKFCHRPMKDLFTEKMQSGKADSPTSMFPIQLLSTT